MREIEADLGIPKTTVSEILPQDLGMKYVVAKFVPWLLLPKQKEHCAAVADDLIQPTTNEPDVLEKSITRNELWVYGCDPDTKDQSSKWKSLGSKKKQQSCSNIMTMVTVFFDFEGVLNHEYTPPGQTIYKEYYIKVIHWLRVAIG